MNVNLPASLPPEESATLRQAEKDLAQRLQREGKWRHLWRIAGQYANVSIFDVDSVEELHALLTALPLFPYMQIDVMPLCRHPSSIRTDDR
jgi:muconolactone D-isomerase